MKSRSQTQIRYLPFGDNALLVELGDVISSETNRKVISLGDLILRVKTKGVRELVPTYRSLLIVFDPLETDHDELGLRVEKLQQRTESSIERTDERRTDIPIVYGGEYGPDLAYVAQSHGLTEEQVKESHSKGAYRVYMTGFVAGFPYLGEVADEIATPRLETPRLKVPAGSVGIAEKQTGIYPCEAPGGWRIIGRTPLKMFDPLRQPPALLKPGDTIKFEPITKEEFEVAREELASKTPPSFKREGQTRAFQVLRTGLLTTVQDLGRFGSLRYGVPISGAMDTFSLVTANLLVGNNPNAAALEMTLIGSELQALTDTQVAVTGGAISPKINGELFPMWQTLDIRKNDTISFGKTEKGCRAYLAIRGGVNAQLVLGSRSTYIRGGFGGKNGASLRIGDTIEGYKVALLKTKYVIKEGLMPQLTSMLRVQVVLGPQVDMFTEKGLDAFLSSIYAVTWESDRMGYRLEGPQIELKGKADMISDALLPGAIQVPKNGKPIVLMKDAQTTGGYPKIAVTTTPDIDRLGQAKPNDVVEFAEITPSQAHKNIHEYFELLNTPSRIVRKKEQNQ